jgi:hypothetical protein
VLAKLIALVPPLRLDICAVAATREMTQVTPAERRAT